MPIDPLEIDVKDIPFALPAHIQRIVMPGDAVAITNPEAIGGATQALVDQEEALQAWTETNFATLQTKINEVSSATNGNTANYTSLEFAITTSDAAYAGRIDTAQAQAAGATAGGSIYLVASAGPGSWTAAVGMYVNTISQYAGLEILVDEVNEIAAISFIASQFYFTDPNYNGGIPGNLISYDNADGAFRFGAPFLAGLQNLDNGSATNEEWNVDDSPCECSFTVPVGADDAKIVINVTYDGDPDVYTSVAQFNITLTDITGGGSTLLKTVKLSQAQSGTGGSAFNFYNYSGLTYAIDGLAPGTYTYRAEIVNTVPLDPGIVKTLNMNIRGRWK